MKAAKPIEDPVTDLRAKLHKIVSGHSRSRLARKSGVPWATINNWYRREFPVSVALDKVLRAAGYELSVQRCRKLKKEELIRQQRIALRAQQLICFLEAPDPPADGPGFSQWEDFDQTGL